MKEKFIHFKKEIDFRTAKEAEEIPETSIVFVQDKRYIYTHGTEYALPGIDSEPISNLLDILDD